MADRTPASNRWPRRYGVLFILLGLLILVEVLTVFAVLASQRFATERALREYSHELLRNVVDETRENAAGYLRQAQDAVILARNLFEAKLLPSDDAMLTLARTNPCSSEPNLKQPSSMVLIVCSSQ